MASTVCVLWFLAHLAEIDATCYLVMMIVFITPTANNVMVMVELSGSSSKEGIARLIGWQYAVSPVVLRLVLCVVVEQSLFYVKIHSLIHMVAPISALFFRQWLVWHRVILINLQFVQHRTAYL